LYVSLGVSVFFFVPVTIICFFLTLSFI
jgi:hypothetical protein